MKRPKIEYVLELTHDEAVALAMISASSHSGARELVEPIVAVSRSLLKLPGIDAAQLALWDKLDGPVFQFGEEKPEADGETTTDDDAGTGGCGCGV